jgi:hypothetical protein
MTDEPGFWMYETSGVLAPALYAYLKGAELTEPQIATLRAYLRQWIMSPIWDQNPHADADALEWLAEMRARIDELTDRTAIARWLLDATEGGLDPL